MSIRRLCMISLLANALLAGALAWRFAGSDAAFDPHSRYEKDRPLAGQALPSAKADEAKPSWSQVQSDDLVEFIRRLEATGCPSNTVRSILTAEIDRRFFERRAELPINTNFWVTAEERDADREQLKRRERDLERETQTVAKDLAGMDWRRPDTRTTGRDEMVETVVLLGDFLTDEKVMQLSEWMEEQRSLSEEAKPSFDIEGPADRASRIARAKESGKELAQILTPAELEEFRLRCHAIELTDVWSVETQIGSEVTGPELREFLRITKGDVDPLRLLGDREEAPTKDSARQKADDAAVRALLGDDRFVAYLTAQEPDFKLHHRFVTRELQLPSATAVELHQIRRAAETRAKEVRRDLALSAEQRGAALDAVFEKTSRSLAGMLEAEKLAAYLKQQSGWVENLKKP